MGKALPAHISHTVLVHAGSYKEFLTKLTSKYPKLIIKFVKKVAIHYYILQLEDQSEDKDGISKQEIYDLPIMALREEFSSFIFFKTIRSYNNVLKRMCHADDNKDAAYELLQHMMTPYEKSLLVDLTEAKSLELTEVNAQNEEMKVTYYTKEVINSIATLNKMFPIDKVKVNDEEKSFIDLIKSKTWIVGIK